MKQYYVIWPKNLFFKFFSRKKAIFYTLKKKKEKDNMKFSFLKKKKKAIYVCAYLIIFKNVCQYVFLYAEI